MKVFVVKVMKLTVQPMMMYHNNIPCCCDADDELDTEPVYKTPTPKYTAERILRILLDPNIPPSKICTTRPTNVVRSATYM